jgi:UDP-glucuronate 4-epimerase
VAQALAFEGNNTVNVLLTGGAGFIGSHVAEALMKRGDRVTVLDCFDTFYDPAIKRRTAARLTTLGVSFVEGDLRNLADVEKAFAAAGQGAGVIHLAARAGVRPSIAQPLLYSEVNVDGTTNMLEVARKQDASRFVFASSSSVYGARSNAPFSEEDRIDRPVSPYAATKIAGEMLCATFAHLYGLETCALRFFTVYGPRQRPDLAIAKFAKLISRNEMVPFFGDGSSARDYTFIDDTVRGVIAALDHRWPQFEVVNLGGSRPVTLKELVAGIERALGQKARLDRQSDQPGDVPLTCAATEKAERLLGWKANTPIDEGLARFAQWFKSSDADGWK